MVSLNLKNNWFNVLYYLICILILVLSLRGIPGNPKDLELNTSTWKENGPLELSTDRGRFALTYSLLENKSFNFSLNIAKFATPDLGYFNGKFVSLFDPGLSFLVIPGYIIGKLLGAAQVGTFAIISIFALLNVFLIRKLSEELGANKIMSAIAGLVFLFATPAFTYSVTLYQHQITTFIILLSTFLLIKYDNFWTLALVWMLLGLSFAIDYPNAVLVFPLVILAIKKIFSIDIQKNRILFRLKSLYILSLLTVLIPISFLLWFNKNSYNKYFQLAGTVTQVTGFDNNTPINNRYVIEDATKYVSPDRKSGFLGSFFYTRNLLEGFYILFLSPDRGIVNYTPVILLGLGGIIVAYKRKMELLPFLFSIIGLNILLYAMWGDPWGGWAFGSRYLIPTYAILSIFISIFLTKYRKYLILLPIFLILFSYSVFVNTAGAITTNAIPPQVEVLDLEKASNSIQKYTYQKNFDYLSMNKSKSFVYQLIGKNYMSSWRYFYVLYTLIMSLSVGLLVVQYADNFKKIFSKISINVFRKTLPLNINFLKRKYD